MAYSPSTQYTEDAAAAANPVGNALILVREDALAGSLTTADGDNVAARGNNKGEQFVKHTDAIAVTNAGTFAVQSAAAGDVAHDGADSGNPLKVGAVARTADQAAVATGDRTNLLATILGKLIVKTHAIPDLTWQFASAAGGVVTTSDVALKAAAGAGIRNYLTDLLVVNSHATISTEVVVKDGSTIIHRGWAQAAGGGYEKHFDPPLRGTANTALNVAEITTTATAGIVVSASGYVAAE